MVHSSIKVVPTKKGMNWMSRMVDLEDLGYTRDIPNCEVVDLLALCAEGDIDVCMDVTIDRVRRVLQYESRRMYGDSIVASRRIIAYAFRMGYLRFHCTPNRKYDPAYLKRTRRDEMRLD